MKTFMGFPVFTSEQIPDAEIWIGVPMLVNGRQVFRIQQRFKIVDNKSDGKKKPPVQKGIQESPRDGPRLKKRLL